MAHARLHDHSNALDGSPIAVAGIPNLSANKITSDILALARIPTMDDAHIPNLETLSYGGAFAEAQIPAGIARDEEALMVALLCDVE